jgi:hypothetical protein
MARYQDCVQRGDRASQPAANTVVVGCQYFVTDEGVTERSNGSAWESYSGGGSGDVSGPGSSTDNAIATWDGTGGDTLQDTTVTLDPSTGLLTGATFPNTGLKVQDTNASHVLTIAPGSNITANRTLTVTTGDADRTLTLTANASIEGTNTGDVTVGGENYLSLSGQAITADPVDLGTSNITGILEAVNGGTGQPSYNKGDMLVSPGASALSIVPVGANGMTLLADSAEPVGMRWATPAGGGNVTGPGTATVNNELVLWDGISGTSIKRASMTGLVKAASGVASAATAGSDYVKPLEFSAGNSGAALTIDWNNGNQQIVTLDASCTLTLTNPVAGMVYRLIFLENATGGWTPTFPASVKWENNTPPVWVTTANNVIFVTLVRTTLGADGYLGFGTILPITAL